MKKQLFTISCIFVAAQLAGATDATLSLDDALYKGVGSEVTQPVTVQPDTIGEVMFDNATFIFTGQAQILWKGIFLTFEHPHTINTLNR